LEAVGKLPFSSNWPSERREESSPNGTYFTTCLRLQIMLSTGKMSGKAVLKSPFPKGGFRGIINRLFNPPLPPFRKGG
jgi:hypothetical protein